MKSRSVHLSALLILLIAVAAPATVLGAATTLPDPNAPFWTGTPDAKQFAQRGDEYLAQAKKAVARVLAVKGKRTIQNTLRPLDDAQNALDMMLSQSSLIEEVHPDSAMRATAEKQTQEGAAYATELSLNRDIYDAIAALDTSGADPATRYYVKRTLLDFHLAGVDKDKATREKIKALSDELVKIGQEFDRNIRQDHTEVILDGPQDLEGLPADYIKAHPAGPDGKIHLSIEYPDLFPILTYAKHEDVRKKMWFASQNRAYPVNMAVLDTLIEKRYELANLIGFKNWADYFTADKMVGSAANARAFIDKIVDASAQREKADYQVLLARKRQDFPNADHIDWWDRWYWTALVKKDDYNFDPQQLRPYFPYDRVKQGVLDVTSKMFGVTYKRVPDAPVWDPSVECYEMYENGKLAGRFYLDMHPRPNKFNHAAQFDIRTGIEGRQIPEAALICNLPGGTPGDPGLCDFDDVNTFFHEFGHLLHTLFAGHQKWVGIGGIRTERDFVEAPSQMLEEWMRDPKTLQTFARNYKTGEPIPTELVHQMVRAGDFGDLDPKGIGIRRQMVLADMSLSIYDRPPSEVNTDSLNEKLTNEYTPYPYVPGSHFQCSFGHLVGYSAGYYTYMWSKVIAEDMFTKFDKSNLLDPTIATRYRDAVLAPGGSKPAAQLVEDFLSRPFNFDAYRDWLNKMPVN